MDNTNDRRCQNRASSHVNITEVKNSLITDMSLGGAGLLISKDKEAASGNICLNVLSPDMSNLAAFDIIADVVWTDHEYSDDFLKIGVQFSDENEDVIAHITDAINWLSKEDHYFLRCEIISKNNE